MTTSTESAPQFSHHGELDCSCVRFTNIGTGAKVDEVEPGKRDRLAGMIPSFIRKGVFLKQTLTEIAVNSEEKVVVLRQFQHLNPDRIMYERFDANHGVSNIKLDDYNALGKIREKTEQYLDEQRTRDLLEEVGSAIATDYINGEPIQRQGERLADSAVDKSLSSGPSSRSDYPESESHILFPNHDNLQSHGPAPLAEHLTAAQLAPDVQGRSKDYVHDDSSVDLRPETLIATAPT